MSRIGSVPPTEPEPPADEEPGRDPLANARHEAMAKALAAGETQARAYLQAGYKGSPSCAGRIARRSDVTARVDVLQAQARAMEGADLEPCIRRLLDIAHSCDEGTALGHREARLARLEAMRLYEVLRERRAGKTVSPWPRSSSSSTPSRR
jgi:hypothetical protein